MTRYAATRIERPHPRLGYVVAHVVSRTDYDAAGRPVAVVVGERRYPSLRAAEAVARLLTDAQPHLAGGRRIPATR